MAFATAFTAWPATPPSGCCRSRRRIDLRWWRQGLADRLGSEFSEDRPQGLDARRERVTIVSGGVGKLFD
jgi:hypothetical protein